MGRLCLLGEGKEDIRHIQGSFMTSGVRDKEPEKPYLRGFWTPIDESV